MKMPMRVYKYKVEKHKPDVEMPKGAQILCIDYQDGAPTMWAMVDRDADTETRRFHVIGTGWDVPEGGVYRGTCFEREATTGFPNGFVWHIWEVQA